MILPVRDHHTGRFTSTKGIDARFWEKVQFCIHGSACRACCWTWLGSIGRGGYGRFAWRDTETRKVNGSPAHRYAFLLTFGHWPMPQGRHVCDNPPCCQPYHIFEGTRLDNAKDALDRNKYVRGSRHYAAKLTDEQVLVIRSLQGAMTHRAIADIYGINKDYVYKIWFRQKWKHLP